MASIYSATSSTGWKLRLDYTSTQDRESNRSTVTCQLYVYDGTGYSRNEYPNEAYYKICGRKVYQTYHFQDKGWYKLGTRSILVSHDADGQGKVTLSGEWCSENAGAAYTPYRLSLSKTVTLPTIPRASGLKFSAMTLGKETKLTVVKKHRNFRHQVSFTLGKTTERITGETGETQLVWTPPLTLAKELTQARSGKGKLCIVTYDGGKELARQEYSVTVYIPETIKPTASVQVEIVQDSSVPQNWTEAVKGKSRLRFTINAAGTYGATVARGAFLFGGQKAEGLHGTTGVLQETGKLVPKATVTDSRGRSTSVEGKTITVYDWYVPMIRSSRVDRCREDGTPSADGTSICVLCTAECAPINGRNSVTVRMRTRQAGGQWGGYNTLENGVVSVWPGFAATASYEVEIEVCDALGGRKTVRYTVPTVAVALHLKQGGRGAAFGKYCEGEGLEVSWPARFYQDVEVGGQLHLHDPMAFIKAAGLLEKKVVRILPAAGKGYTTEWTRQSTQILPAWGIVLVNAAVRITTTEKIPAATLMKIGQLESDPPVGLCAAAVYAASENPRRYMGLVNSDGAVEIRPNTDMPASGYTLYLSAAYCVKGESI